MEMQKKSFGLQRVKSAVMLCFAFLLFCNGAFAQTAAVKGTVYSESGKEPIIGATVIVEGTQMGTITDMDGKFSLPNAPAKGTLTFSYLGYKDIKAAIVDGKSYEIKMSENAEMIEEVVVVGYGTQRKAEVTGAVTRVDTEEMVKINTADLGTALQGQVAGVNIQSSSGEPGSSSNIQIRGISSITGDNTPLFVVDGVPFESDPGLSSSEIASVDILKDAASAAVYGTRGSAGVILITTKKGQAGKPKVMFNMSYALQRVTSDIALSDTNEYLYVDLLNNRATSSSTGSSGNTDDTAWTSLRNNSKSFYNESNFYDTIVQDYQPIQNYSVNIGGGSDNITYALNASYFSQEGIIINSEFSRINVRASMDIKINSKLSISSVMNIKMEDQLSPTWGLLPQAYGSSPFSTPVDASTLTVTESSEDSSSLSNSATTLAQLTTTTTKETDGYNGNFNLKYAVNKHLTLSSRLGVNYSSANSLSIRPYFEIYESDGSLYTNAYTRSYLKNNAAYTESLTSESMINWTNSYGKHKVTATGVFSAEQYDYQSYYAQIYDLTTNEIKSLNAGTSDQSVGVGSGQWGQDKTNTLVGMLARVQYNYADKYMLSGSIRRDASSRFSAENRWGMFPSVSAGWNVSKENFWNVSKIKSLKLRASFGTTGNQNISDYAFQTYLTSSLDYAFGGDGQDTESLGQAMTAYANEDVKWETTEQINVGIDAVAFKNKVTFTADIYQSNKRDMLFPLKMPGSAGTGTSTTVAMNVGNMTNKGIELALGYRSNYKKLYYNANFTFSTNKNEITDMGGTSTMYYFSDGSPCTYNTVDYVTVIAEGYEAGAFMVMPTNGLVNTEEKLYEYQKLDSSAQMGDLIYVDSNGDGTIDDSDRVYGGSGTPAYELGLNYNFSYKGFDFSMNWYASLGNEVINGNQIYSYQKWTSSDLVYSWSEVNADSSIPAVNGGTSHSNYRSYADIWVQDGSFLRLKNMTLGYSIPKKILQKFSLTRLRVYVAADNLLTITKYDGYDPEVGSNGLSKKGLDWGTYPITMQMRAGLQLGF